MTWLVDAPAYALLDAAKGFGYVAAHRAMSLRNLQSQSRVASPWSASATATTSASPATMP